MRNSVFIVLYAILFGTHFQLLAQDNDVFLPEQREQITINNISQIERVVTVGGGWELRNVDWSPDGNFIAVASEGGVLLYDATDLYIVPQLLDGHTQEVTGVAFSPSGKYLASVSHDQSVRIWDIDTGTTISVWEHDQEWTFGVRYGANDNQLAVQVSKEILLFDTTTGSLIDSFDSYKSAFDSTVSNYPRNISPNKMMRATIIEKQGQDELQLWDVDTDELLVNVPIGNNTKIVWSSDSTQLVTYPTYYGEKYLWDLNDLLEGKYDSAMVELDPYLPIYKVAFSPDNTRLAIVTWDPNHGQQESSLWVWELHENLQPPTILRSVKTDAPRLNNEATLLYYQGSLWNLKSGRILNMTDDTIWNISNDFSKAISTGGIDYRQDERYQTTYCYRDQDDCRVTQDVWDISSGQLLKSRPSIQPENMRSVDNLHVIEVENGVQLLDVETNEVIYTLEHDNPIMETSFNLNRTRLITTSLMEDRETAIFTLWDVESSEKLNSIQLPRDYLEYTFNANETLVVFGSQETAYFWNMITGEELYSFKGPEPNTLSDVAFSTDGFIFAVAWGDWTNLVELRDIRNGELIDMIEGFPNNIIDVAFSPDDNFLAVTSQNQIWLWDIIEGTVQVLSNDAPHKDVWYDDIQFSPDSRLIIAEYTHYPDAFTDLWDIENERLIITLDGNDLQVTGNWDLFMTEDKGLVHFWGIPLNNEVVRSD